MPSGSASRARQRSAPAAGRPVPQRAARGVHQAVLHLIRQTCPRLPHAQAAAAAAHWARAINSPPKPPRGSARSAGTTPRRLAKKRVGQSPETPAQKVAAIHRLAGDDEVAAQVAADVLRRPAVAAKVVADDTARHMVNRAQSTQHRTEVVHDLIADDTVAAQVASDVLRRPEVAARIVADDTARHAVNRPDRPPPAAGRYVSPGHPRAAARPGLYRATHRPVAPLRGHIRVASQVRALFAYQR
ncbi:DUF6192 family protein [Streptomyces fildesensis]|uniref:DUF6192 family protein n=1 Tax=Streptomyces fildesensis TaxID=375757 RepID=A0ABW8CJQ3_9ACTN